MKPSKQTREPYYAWDPIAQVILERRLGWSVPVETAIARKLCSTLRDIIKAIESTCPEVADFVGGMAADLHNSLTAQRAAERALLCGRVA